MNPFARIRTCVVCCRFTSWRLVIPYGRLVAHRSGPFTVVQPVVTTHVVPCCDGDCVRRWEETARELEREEASAAR